MENINCTDCISCKESTFCSNNKYCDDSNYSTNCSYSLDLNFCDACHFCKSLCMTRYNVFCCSPISSFRKQTRLEEWRAFNKEVGEERYMEIKHLIRNIFFEENTVELQDNPDPLKQKPLDLYSFWESVTLKQWYQLLAIPEATDFKESLELISRIKMDSLIAKTRMKYVYEMSCINCNEKYNIFCYKGYNYFSSKYSSLQKQWRVFNKDVDEERFNEIKIILKTIFKEDNLSILDNFGDTPTPTQKHSFWESITTEQWNKLLSIPEARNFKDGFEFIRGVTIKNTTVGKTTIVDIAGESYEVEIKAVIW